MALPLNVLLSHAVLDLTRAAERLDPTANVVQWSCFLRVADGAPVKRLHLDARISKRATKSYVGRGTTAGVLRVEDGVVRLTDAGRAQRDAWGDAVDGACRAFEAHHGDALRCALEPVVASFELEHAHYLHPYGAPDPSITGGGAAGRQYGADFKPVQRERAADTTSGLSILALLSQALTAFAITYEAQLRGPLLWAAYLQSCLHEPTPLADLPPALGVPGTITRHGFVSVSGGLAHLTGRGQPVRGAYPTLVEQVELGWPAAASLRAALERVDSSLPDVHAVHPWVAFTPADGFSERSGRAAPAGR